jgi:hypothetical protein
LQQERTHQPDQLGLLFRVMDGVVVAVALGREMFGNFSRRVSAQKGRSST